MTLSGVVRTSDSQSLAHDKQKSGPAQGNQFESWLETHSEFVALVIVGIGLVARLSMAWGTFLNPDEAFHFFIANRASWTQAYDASLSMAHPPLLIFVLYWWRALGSSEFVLRMPSVLAGTAFCWIFFQWLRGIFGRTVGLMGLVFVALLPRQVSLSAEVRQYQLLLLFLISAAYFLERAVAKNSPGQMLLSSVCLYLAMISHYSAFLFVAAIGVYAALRMIRRRVPRKVAISWGLGQLGALGLAVFLYMTHISRIKGTTIAVQAFQLWLYRSYFHPGHGHVFTFALTRSFSVFQYLLGQLVIGDIAGLLFITGIILLRSNARSRRPDVPVLPVGCLLVLPFLLNCSAALVGVYPYGGTRHCVFLVIFTAAGISLGLARIAGGRALPGIGLAVLTVLLCYAFRTLYTIDLPRADQSRTQMQRAIAFVRERIPPSQPILVDYETSLELGHYLCEQQPISYDNSTPGFNVFYCGAHRIVSTTPDIWTFGSPTLEAWNKFVRGAGFRRGDPVWVAQAGWSVALADELQKNYAEFRQLQKQAFGRNIVFFRMLVD